MRFCLNPLPTSSSLVVSTAHDDLVPSLQAYTTPGYFRDDWLNDYHDACQHGRASQGTPHASKKSI